jgi:hypothetical protein
MVVVVLRPEEMTIMTRTARVVGGVSIVLAPLAVGISDQLRMLADPPDAPGIVGEYGLAQATTSLASIDANRGTFVAASTLLYLATLLMIPALLTIWRLSVQPSRRWAWAGAILATVSVFGNAVHLMSYNTMSLVFAGHHHEPAVMDVWMSAETVPFFAALFAPYVLGLLAPIPQAIGLRGARVIPLWACLAIIAATAILVALGSYPWVTALWTLLMVSGLAPAAVATLRDDPASAILPEPHVATA